MKLHVVVGSNNARKVLAVVDHLGLKPELAWYDFFEGDLQSPEFLALNPNGKVPVLEDGELVLWESNAINVYLAAEKAPGNSLFPQDPRARADVLRWQSWELAHFNSHMGLLVWEGVVKPKFFDQQPDAALVDFASGFLTRFAGVLEKHLEGRTFIVGDDWTLADYAVGHIQAFKDAIPFDWSPFPNVNAFYDRLADNPHWAATAPASPEAIGRRPAT